MMNTFKEAIQYVSVWLLFFLGVAAAFALFGRIRVEEVSEVVHVNHYVIETSTGAVLSDTRR